jgi:hypothetical protein
VHRVDLEKLTADAPEGYKLPKAFVELVEHADAHGWESAAAWFWDHSENPYLSIELRRFEPDWNAKLTWHSRPNGLGADFPHGRLRLFSGIWQRDTVYDESEHTNHRVIVALGWYWRDVPSLKQLREAIAANPVPKV